MHRLESHSGILGARAARRALRLVPLLASAALISCADSSISLLPGLASEGDASEAPNCVENADCGEREPFCDSTTGSCVECLSDTDCGGAEPQKCLLEAGECVQCLADADCGADEPYCDLDGNRCEECLLDAHCVAGEICDSQEERCVEAPTPQ